MPRWRVGLIALAVVGVVAGVWQSVENGSILTGLVTLGAGAGALGTIIPRAPRPSELLADEVALETLAERRERERREREEKERIKKTRGDRHAMMLRDLGRIRRAIAAEVRKLSSPEPLVFAWGGRRNTAEERRYWVEEGRLRFRFTHEGTGSTWEWPEGGIPTTQTRRAFDANDLQDVEHVYSLFQPERHLVSANLGEEMEADDPGYGRFARSDGEQDA
jgi:hypothetical protein